MTLKVLEDSNHHIRRKGNVRVLFCPPIAEDVIAAHIIDLLGTICFSECIGGIGVSEVHTQQC
jgi:hypothetical protein